MRKLQMSKPGGKNGNKKSPAHGEALVWSLLGV
jgi:hypothetical protein